MMETPIFLCQDCGIRHTLGTRDGLVDAIAHIIYEDRKKAGLEDYGSAETDKSHAERIVEWYEEENYIRNREWEQEREDYEKYQNLYDLYHQCRLRNKLG